MGEKEDLRMRKMGVKRVICDRERRKAGGGGMKE
jgi:hypothetical protein